MGKFFNFPEPSLSFMGPYNGIGNNDLIGLCEVKNKTTQVNPFKQMTNAIEGLSVPFLYGYDPPEHL